VAPDNVNLVVLDGAPAPGDGVAEVAVQAGVDDVATWHPRPVHVGAASRARRWWEVLRVQRGRYARPGGTVGALIASRSFFFCRKSFYES
jgi:hypothetical protein